VSSQCIVEIRPVGEDPAFKEMQGAAPGLMQNISGGGICVRMREDPGAGTLLALNIHLSGLPTSVIALGRVCWTEPQDTGEHEVGIEFWWVGWHDAGPQEAIRRFIATKLDGSPAAGD
jgi:Tfp pilus assembly protein PilZ